MDLSVLNNVPYCMDAFAKWTHEFPDLPMLVDDQHYKGWTRARIDDLSARIYGYLKRQGIGTDDFVMICLPRGIRPIVAMIGVWKAGAAFVVVEDTYAPDRIELIKADCGCKVTIDMDVWEQIKAEEPLAGYERPDDHDAAFAVYTSGSTGRPKGVLHEFGDIKLDALVANLQIELGTRGALIAPLNFVVAIKALTGVLYAPCTFFIVPYATVKNPRKLIRYYIDNKVNLTYLSPSLIRAVGDDLGPYLKIVHTGSEPANGVYLPGIQLVNNYAMSEGFFTLCQFVIDKPYDVCPVGKPNSPIIQIRIVDDEGNDVPEGETGELIYENPFMRGYINLPEQTAEALRDGWYHTNDLGFRDENGNIILVGRANDMIKIDGNRIEPAEIEAAFKYATGKEWAAAKGFEDPSESFVCVYYMGELEQGEDEIRAKMSEKVPYYMIPSFFMQIEEPPILPNGKLARKDLPNPRSTMERVDYVAPTNDFEKALCEAFELALGVEHIGITEDFYSLGGNSVAAMKVLTIMKLDALSAIDIYQGRTVVKIEELYEEKLRAGDTGLSEEEKEMEARKVPHELPAIQVSIIDYQLFTPDAPMWIFPYLFSFGEDADAERILDAARKVQAHHPIFGTIFEFNDNAELQQRYDSSAMPTIEIEHMTDDEFEELQDSQIETFQLLGKPMIKIRVIKTESDCYLMVIFHHIIMDGSSMQIIFQSFARAYAGEPLELDTYYSYLEDEERLRSTSAYRNAFEYYQQHYDGIDWMGEILPDKSEPGNVNGQAVIMTNMSPSSLEQMGKRCGISSNNFVNAATLLTLARMSGKRDVLINSTFHNRVDKRKQCAAGLLAHSLPVGVKLDSYDTLKDLYTDIATKTEEVIANSVYDWVTINENPYMNDHIAVVYETAAITDMSALEKMNASMETLSAHNEAALRRNMLQVFETEDAVVSMLSYMANIYTDERIKEFTNTYTELINQLLEVTDPASVKVADLL
ncbi:MAG: non-ribosomal peptide synthetase [Coriobacteriales bacterium]|nr:non-ribosomal peptide synthetase [Coriobacteriales bacterium]